MGGYQVEVNHRFGGHGGVATEWEISAPNSCDARDRLRAIAEECKRAGVYAADNLDNFRTCVLELDLREGTPVEYVLEIVRRMVSMDFDPAFDLPIDERRSATDRGLIGDVIIALANNRAGEERDRLLRIAVALRDGLGMVAPK